MSPAADPRALLRRMRRRLLGQALLSQLGAALLLSGAVLLLVAVADRWRAPGLWRPWLLLAVPAALAALALLRVFLRAPALLMLARVADRVGQTRDRFATALAFSGVEDSWQSSARRECETYLAARDFRLLFPWRIPREWLWLPVAAIALMTVRWEARLHRRDQALAAVAAQEKVAPTVEALQKLAERLAALPNEKRSDELKRLAEQIARGAQELHRGVHDPRTAEQAALRELSALEQMVQEMQHPNLSPEDLQALAKALAEQEATREAAKALQAEDPAAAAKALEEAANQLAGAGEAARQQAATALQQALERMAEQHALSEAMKRAGQLAGENGGASEALRQLAEMLRQMPQQQQGGAAKGGQPASSQDLQRVLAALQNLKFGRPDYSSSQSGQSGEGPDGPPMLQIAPPSSSSDQPMLGQIPNASGQPGGEHDVGTTDSPFGRNRQEPTSKGADLALHGQQSGRGESFSQLLPGGPDATKARRQYKELYEAMAPAAEDAVLQEEIPLGSRRYIQRYFEAIRPKE